MLALQLVGKNGFPPDGAVVAWSILVRSHQGGRVGGMSGVQLKGMRGYFHSAEGFFSMEVLPILLGELCIEQIHIALRA